MSPAGYEALIVLRRETLTSQAALRDSKVAEPEYSGLEDVHQNPEDYVCIHLVC